VPGDPGHSVACLLGSETRRRIWAELRAGLEPDSARRAAEAQETSA
jgi:peptide/nickel transport system ATP-binding protein